MLGKFYPFYGFLVLAAVATAQFRGWSFMPVTRLKNVPASVRDNPGSYRAIYNSYHHYTGGK